MRPESIAAYVRPRPLSRLTLSVLMVAFGLMAAGCGGSPSSPAAKPSADQAPDKTPPRSRTPP